MNAPRNVVQIQQGSSAAPTWGIHSALGLWRALCAQGVLLRSCHGSPRLKLLLHLARNRFLGPFGRGAHGTHDGLVPPALFAEAHLR